MNHPTPQFLSQTTTNPLLNLSSEFALIRATGADARTFLHMQLSQDVLSLNHDEVRLAAYCSAKGRMFAIVHLFAHPLEGEDAIYLLTHHSVADTLIRRLRMFVLRAKVTLSDVSADYIMAGYVGAEALDNGVKSSSDEHIRLGILPAQIDGKTYPREFRLLTKATSIPTQISELWRWLNVRAGFAYVTTEISETFVPQMMNLDRIGGVNFKKGCYPGQEIVARSHYLGKLKRRMLSASIRFTDPIPTITIGMDVHTSSDTSQPAGQIVAYATNPIVPNTVDVLYEISLPMTENNAVLSLANTEGDWQPIALPYA